MTQPAGQVGSVARRWLFADFVTDDATDSGTADGAGRAAAGQDGPADGTDPGADRGVLPLLRHAGTSPKTKQQGCGNCTERQSL
jgi:hypothetical protein